MVSLCLETIFGGHAILVFCSTKQWCEKLSETIAKEFHRLCQLPPTKGTNDLLDLFNNSYLGLLWIKF